MKLNADILFDNLKRHYSLRMCGTKLRELHLSHVRMYCREETLRDNYVYVSKTEWLPFRPHFPRNALLILIGESPQIESSCSCCTLFVDDSYAMANAVLNEISDIFEKYNRWETDMQDFLTCSTDIQTLVDLSVPYINTCIEVYDKDFCRCAGSAGGLDAATLEAYSLMQVEAYKPYKTEKISTSLKGGSGYEPYLNINYKEPIVFNQATDSTGDNYAGTFSKNLFVKNQNAGVLSVTYCGRAITDGEVALANFLAEMIEKAMGLRWSSGTTRANSLKKLLLHIISDGNISFMEKMSLENTCKDCIFIKICTTSSSQNRFPLSYVESTLAHAFAESILFPHDSGIVMCVENQGDPKQADSFAQSLKKLLDKLQLAAGVSDVFPNLTHAKVAYTQANAALQAVIYADNDQRLIFFEDIRLNYLIVNGIHPHNMSMYLDRGLRHLLEKDKHSDTDYIKTLRVFLNNNMNTAKASTDLYIHRSTLTERLERIEKILKHDLKSDNKYRLYVELVLQALDIMSN